MGQLSSMAMKAGFDQIMVTAVNANNEPQWPTLTIARNAALARPDDCNSAPVNANLMVERRDVTADRDGQGFSMSLISGSLWPYQPEHSSPTVPAIVSATP
jgi:hypothetical protein